jgi:hypothetical protein
MRKWIVMTQILLLMSKIRSFGIIRCSKRSGMVAYLFWKNEFVMDNFFCIKTAILAWF